MFPGSACDVECDCRFIMFCRKIPPKDSHSLAEWKIQYVKLFYEKDKAIPLDGKPLPGWDQKVLDKYPEGYKWLGAAQERLGHDMLYDLPAFDNAGFHELLKGMSKWFPRILGQRGMCDAYSLFRAGWCNCQLLMCSTDEWLEGKDEQVKKTIGVPGA